MKKVIALLLCLAAPAFLLAGCGKREAASPSEPESGAASDAESAAASVPMTTSEAARHNEAINPADVRIIQFDDPDPGDRIAVIKTSEGDIRVRLFHEQAPKTVEEFVKLAKEGYYNGQSFFSTVDGYKIEGGGAKAVGEFPAEPEFSLDLWNFRGAVALSNKDTDFLIVQADRCLNPEEELRELNFPQKVVEKYLEVGGAPHQDWVNPVFGAVIEGMDVVDKIAAGALGEDSKPVNPVIITEVKIEEA